MSTEQRDRDPETASAAIVPDAMHTEPDQSSFPPERIAIEKRRDGAIVVRVKSDGPESSRLPDAVFSFRCGDPQYAYWLRRLGERPTES